RRQPQVIARSPPGRTSGLPDLDRAYEQRADASRARLGKPVVSQIGDEIHRLGEKLQVGEHHLAPINEPSQLGGCPVQAKGVPADREVGRSRMYGKFFSSDR